MSKADDDFRKGLLGTGGGSGTDYLNGVAERERREREYLRRSSTSNAPAPAPAGTPSAPPSPGGPLRDSGSSGSAGSEVPETLTTMAQSGAGLFAALFIGYTLLQDDGWSCARMIGGAIGASLVGAIGGAALYIALKVLKFALKVVFGLLVVGIGLHLLGVFNI